MERELNKLFNDTNYNKENVIIREIWSIKLELQNFFWGVYLFIMSSECQPELAVENFGHFETGSCDILNFRLRAVDGMPPPSHIFIA